MLSSQTRLKLHILCHCKSKEDRGEEAHVPTASSDHRLAFIVAVPLVLIHEQRLVALTLVRPGTHGTGGGGENNRNHDEGSDYRHGYDFSQSERLTWKSGGGGY